MYSETKVLTSSSAAADHIFEPSESNETTTDFQYIKPLDQHIIDVSSSIADQDLELQELSSTLAQYDSQNEVTQFEMVLQECHLKTANKANNNHNKDTSDANDVEMDNEDDTDAESDAFNQFYLSYIQNQQQEYQQDEVENEEPAADEPVELEYSMDEFHDTFSDLLLRFYNCEDQASPQFVDNLNRSILILSQWERLGGINTKALLNYIIDQVCNVIQSILKKLVTKAIMKYSLVDIDLVRTSNQDSSKNQNDEEQENEDLDALTALQENAAAQEAANAEIMVDVVDSESIIDDQTSAFDDAQMMTTSMSSSTIQASQQNQSQDQQQKESTEAASSSQQYAGDSQQNSSSVMAANKPEEQPRIVKYVTSENAEDFQMMVYTLWQYFELVMQTSNRLEDLWLNILESLNLEKPNKLTVFSMVHHQAYRNIILKDELIRQIITEVEENRYYFCSTEQLIKMQNNQNEEESEQQQAQNHTGKYLDKIYGIRRRANSVEESYSQFLENYERSCHLKYLFMCATQFDQKFQQFAMQNSSAALSTTNNQEEISQQQYESQPELPANYNNEPSQSMILIQQQQEEEVSNNEDVLESSLSKSDSDEGEIWFPDD